MTKDELILITKATDPKDIIIGALGEMKGCQACVEQTKKGGMWQTKYFGIFYWFKGVTDNEIIDRVTITKKAFMFIFQMAFPFGLLSWRKIKERLTNIYTCEGGLKSRCLKQEEFCPTCQELIRVGLKFFKDRESIELIFCIAMYLQFSTSYRVRVQDFFEIFNKERFNKAPFWEIIRVKRLMMQRENAQVEKEKMSLLFNYLAIVTIFRTKVICKLVAEIDIERMRFDESDWYFVLRRPSYDFKGVSLRERLKEAERIDKEQGNIILGIDIGHTEVDGLPEIFIKGEDAFLFYLPQGDFLELRRIWINEKLRKKGYGKILVEELEKITKEANLKVIKVVSDTKPTQVFGKFLISVGFMKIGDPPFLWEKKL